jgi:hypothetical protein
MEGMVAGGSRSDAVALRPVGRSGLEGMLNGGGELAGASRWSPGPVIGAGDPPADFGTGAGRGWAVRIARSTGHTSRELDGGAGP